MSTFIDWLRGRFGSEANGASRTPNAPAPSTPEVLEKARSLAREGQWHEASRLYSQIGRKQATADILLEHADLLLVMGDRFGAATKSARVLEKEPENERALAIRREVLRLEDADRKG